MGAGWGYVRSGLGVGAALGEAWWSGDTGVLPGVAGLEGFMVVWGLGS